MKKNNKIKANFQYLTKMNTITWQKAKKKKSIYWKIFKTTNELPIPSFEVIN